MEANGSPKPEFETDEARTYFISRFYIHEGFKKELTIAAKKEPKRSQKGAEKEPKKGEERKRAILKLIAETPTITQVQLMNELILTRKQIQTDIKKLQEEGILERVGSNRKGCWVIKRVEK